MIGEVGVFALILSLWFALLGIIRPSVMFAMCQFGFLLLSFCSLVACFVLDDFTVVYVMNNSSIALPWFYKVCAVWGGHEGSMLLWVLILSCWTLFFLYHGRHIEPQLKNRMLLVLNVLQAGLILFVLSTSNPFLRQFQILTSEGRDLNPLLQDPGFLFHPPVLYLGYVGFALPFAFAIATLWNGKLDKYVLKLARAWTLLPWCFLTAGIVLGSWWAYRELGWGGWWFWDPVENASFMPWLAGTALIHALLMTAKRMQFAGWTLLLAIITFSLSLVGTFLVRSGVLTSVHAFAVDPLRGLYILLLLGTITGGALLLFAMRAPMLANSQVIRPLSRESTILLGTTFMIVAMLTILLGTIYPLAIDALNLGKLSVGAPYFNAVFVPIMAPVFILMGLGLHLRWNENNGREVWSKLRTPVLLIILFAGFLYSMMPSGTATGLLFALWIIITTWLIFFAKARRKGIRDFSRSFTGMLLAHFGIAVTIIGIAVSDGYGIKRDIRLLPGMSAECAGYTIKMLGEHKIQGANWHGVEAEIQITRGKYQNIIYPQKRIYHAAQMAMTESAIDVSAFRDLYVALGDPLDDGAWSVRVLYKPLVRLIWGGGLMIFLGGFIAFCDRRYREVKE